MSYAECEDVSSVVATLLVVEHGGGRCWGIVGRAGRNVHDDIAEGVARTGDNVFGKERIGGVHFDAVRFFGEVQRFGFRRIS